MHFLRKRALCLPAHCCEGRTGLRLASGQGFTLNIGKHLHFNWPPNHWLTSPWKTGDLPVCHSQVLQAGVTRLMPSFSSAFFQASSTFKYTHRRGIGHIFLFSQFSEWCSVLQNQLSRSLTLINFLCGI